MRYTEYNIMEEVYNGDRACRSHVPLMNHINEGLAILIALRASEEVQRAFCIHPVVQNSMPNVDLSEVPENIIKLATEYRDKANAYLCRPDTDYVETFLQVDELVGGMSEACALMLYADKIQNQKDFDMYHKGIHRRSDQLEKYFNNWLVYLRTILVME